MQGAQIDAVVAVGINYERIFKIKAISGHRPDADPLLVAQGFIPFKKGQAFYVLAHYPQLDAYFVSNQYAVPFGRTALCGLVPAPLFAHVDLYSSDSTKVPPPSPSPSPAQEGLPSPPPSPAAGKRELFAIAAVAVAHEERRDEYPLAVVVRLNSGAFVQAATVKKYQDFARFHQAMKDHTSPDKARFLPVLPPRPTAMQALSNPTNMNSAMRDLHVSLQVYLNQVIEAGFIDALSLFLLPPGFDESSMKPIDYTPSSNEQFSTPATSHISQNLVQSPDMESDQQKRQSSESILQQQQQQQQDQNQSIPRIPHPQNQRISNTASNALRNSSNSLEKHQSGTLEPSSLGSTVARHSSLLSEATNRASFQSLANNPSSEFRNSVASDTFFISNQRESVISTNSRNSLASNRLSISSRRGSAMVGILKTDLDNADVHQSSSTNNRASKQSNELPPRAPVTLFGAGGPVRSSLPIQEDGDEDEGRREEEEEEGAGGLETEEDVKKRNRNFVITGSMASELEGLEGLSLNPTTLGSKPPVPYTSAGAGSRRGSEAQLHHHPLPGGLPARTSSKQQHYPVTGTTTAPGDVTKLLAQEATIINAYFEEDDLRSHAGEARSALPGGGGIGNGERKVMRKETSTTSLRGSDAISGRSSSLGWRKEG